MLEKFFILIISIFLVLSAGSANIFPIYLQKLMDKYNFTLYETNLYGSFITLGTWVGFPIGYIYDSYGPKISILIGTIFISGGYYLLYFLLNTNYYLNVSIYPFLFLGFFLGQGCSLLYTTALATNLKNFKFKQNSSIVGLLVSNIAISPSIFTTYRQLLGNSDETFYFYFSIFLFLICFFSMFIVSNIRYPYLEDNLLKKYQKYKEKRIIACLTYYNFFIIIIFVFGVLYNYFKDKYIVPLIIIYPILQLLSFSLIFLENFGFFDKLYYPSFRKKMDLIAEKQLEMQNLQNEEINNKHNTSSNNNTNNNNIINNQLILKERDISSIKEIEADFIISLKSPKLILLFFSLFLGLGSTMSSISNINFILKSLSYKIHYNGINKGLISIYKAKELFFYVILYFTFNSLIRISSVSFLDFLIKKNKLILYFIIFSIIGFISQLTGILMNKKLLYLSIALGGATHGAYMSFIPIFVKNEFGLKNMGKFLGLLTSGAGFGSIIISEFVFTYLYNYYTKISGEIQCFGKQCFKLTFILTSIFFAINIFISFFFFFFQRKK